METTFFENGILYVNNQIINIEDLVWNEHPVCKGVFLKHVLKGEHTSNQLSYHLVKVEAGCEISKHIHAGKTEIHEIVSGSGVALIENQYIQYEKGTVNYIPADKEHNVMASDKGLLILAKFFPALL